MTDFSGYDPADQVAVNPQKLHDKRPGNLDVAASIFAKSAGEPLANAVGALFEATGIIDDELTGATRSAFREDAWAMLARDYSIQELADLSGVAAVTLERDFRLGLPKQEDLLDPNYPQLQHPAIKGLLKGTGAVVPQKDAQRVLSRYGLEAKGPMFQSVIDAKVRQVRRDRRETAWLREANGGNIILNLGAGITGMLADPTLWLGIGAVNKIGSSSSLINTYSRYIKNPGGVIAASEATLGATRFGTLGALHAAATQHPDVNKSAQEKRDHVITAGALGAVLGAGIEPALAAFRGMYTATGARDAFTRSVRYTGYDRWKDARMKGAPRPRSTTQHSTVFVEPEVITAANAAARRALLKGKDPVPAAERVLLTSRNYMPELDRSLPDVIFGSKGGEMSLTPLFQRGNIQILDDGDEVVIRFAEQPVPGIEFPEVRVPRGDNAEAAREIAADRFFHSYIDQVDRFNAKIGEQLAEWSIIRGGAESPTGYTIKGVRSDVSNRISYYQLYTPDGSPVPGAARKRKKDLLADYQNVPAAGRTNRVEIVRKSIDEIEQLKADRAIFEGDRTSGVNKAYFARLLDGHKDKDQLLDMLDDVIDRLGPGRRAFIDKLNKEAQAVAERIKGAPEAERTRSYQEQAKINKQRLAEYDANVEADRSALEKLTNQIAREPERVSASDPAYIKELEDELAAMEGVEGAADDVTRIRKELEYERSRTEVVESTRHDVAARERADTIRSINRQIAELQAVIDSYKGQRKPVRRTHLADIDKTIEEANRFFADPVENAAAIETELAKPDIIEPLGEVVPVGTKPYATTPKEPDSYVTRLVTTRDRLQADIAGRPYDITDAPLELSDPRAVFQAAQFKADIASAYASKLSRGIAPDAARAELIKETAESKDLIVAVTHMYDDALRKSASSKVVTDPQDQILKVEEEVRAEIIGNDLQAVADEFRFLQAGLNLLDKFEKHAPDAPAEYLAAVSTGSILDGFGVADDAWTNASNLTTRLVNVIAIPLKEEGLIKFARAPENQAAIVNAKHEIQFGRVSTSVPITAEARRVAELLLESERTARQLLKNIGIHRNELTGYVAHFHDPAGYRTILGWTGEHTPTPDEAFEAWFEFMAPRIDVRRSFEVSTPEDLRGAMRGFYDSVTTEREFGPRGFGYNDPHHERVLHFNSPEAEAEYLASHYAKGDSVVANAVHILRSNARRIAVQRVFPGESTYQIAKKGGENYVRWRMTDPALDGATRKKLQAQLDIFLGKRGTIALLPQTKLDNHLRQLLNEYNVPEHEQIALVSQMFRTLVSSITLGGAVFAQAGDSVLTAHLLSRLEGSQGIIKGFMQLFKDTGLGKEDVASFLDEYSRVLTGQGAADRFSDTAGMAEWLYKGNEVIFKILGMTQMTEIQRSAAAKLVSNTVAGHAGKTYKFLPKTFKDELVRFGVTPHEWDIIRRHAIVESRTGSGSKLVDADAITQSVPRGTIENLLKLEDIQSFATQRSRLEKKIAATTNASERKGLEKQLEKLNRLEETKFDPQNVRYSDRRGPDDPEVKATQDALDRLYKEQSDLSAQKRTDEIGQRLEKIDQDIMANRRKLARLQSELIMVGGPFTPAQIEARIEEIARKTANMIQSMVNFRAVPSVDGRSSLILNAATKPGSVAGEMVRFLTHLKHFTTAMSRQIVGREIFGNAPLGAGFSEQLADSEWGRFLKLFAALTGAGYVAMSAKDLAAGREIRDPTQTDVIVESMLRGGAAAILGDVLVGAGRYGNQSPVMSLMGPSINLLSQGSQIVARGREAAITGGEYDTTANMARFLMDNFPLSNTFYIRPFIEPLRQEAKEALKAE